MEKTKDKIFVERVDVHTLTDFKPSYVKCIKSGNITEFVCLSKSPAPFPVVKIDKDHYVLLETGEVFDYEHSDNKSQNLQAVRRTISNLRGIINANCIDEEKMRWVTLTYAENMTDTERLYNDFKNFWKRFCYWCKKQHIAKPEYIAVAEPQERGAWHMHLILLFREKAPYIANNEVLAPLWGQGFTKIKAVHGCDNIGAYFSAYLADMPLEDFQKSDIAHNGNIYEVKECAVSDDGTEGKTKAFVKGARLHFYPSGMNIYRCSRGIVYPTVTTMDNNEYQKKKASAGTLTFSHACNVVSRSSVVVYAADCSHSDDIKNTILHEYYNTKRTASQLE